MTTTPDAAREARRKARANWPIRSHPLGEEPRPDDAELSPDDRVRLVGELTLRAWLLAGNELPSLPRSEWPGSIVRGA